MATSEIKMPDLTRQTAQAGRGFIERVVGNPVLVDPHRVSEFEGCLASLIGHERFEMFMDRMDSNYDGYWPKAGSWEESYKPYNVKDGILQIPVFGALINRMGYQVGRNATGYTYIERAFDRGMADMAVKGIAFLIDSPGGEAAGNFELVEKLTAGRGKKPMRSFVADSAYSGGYSIATASKEIIVTRSGGTGSVGVVTMHVDMSGYLEQAGMKVTFIKAGKHKVDGNRFEPLSEAAQKRIQTRIDKIYGVFVSTVAKNRDMGEDAVRATEALTYDADESVSVGFADKIGAFDEELASFADGAADLNGEDEMTDKTQAPALTQESLDAAVAAATAQATTEATTAGVAAERARFATVMASDHYKGRETLATKMLTTTNLTAEEVVGLLEDAPKATADPKNGKDAKVEGRNHFKEKMDRDGGAGIVSEEGDDDEANTPAVKAQSILASFRSLGGATVKKPAAH